MNANRILNGTVGIVLAVVSMTATAGRADTSLTLANKASSEFAIVIAKDASPSTRYGAEELQRFLKQMTGAQLPIRGDDESVTTHEIILGDNAHLRKLGLRIDFDRLGSEGYVIRTAGGHLVIAGGELRGNLYGVYGLLEDHLGCRWFTPTVSRIPKRDTLVIKPIDETRIPVLEYREPFVKDCFDGDWCARNRMNSSAASLEARHGGKVRFGRGMFVHTFNRLVPPDKYFDAHPEYFSEVNGKRIREHTQLCCTNEDVIRICTEQMRKRMREDPDAFVFSLSQNDWANYCECSNCRAVVEREGSQIGPALALVNRVAEALEKEFPGKAIETLAYSWSRKPPKTLKPRPNVIIRLCSIECCFMHPLATCDRESNRAFVRDLQGWAKVADRLWIWDYVTSFSDYLAPFPNLRVRDDNIRLFAKNHVTGIFEQDVYTTVNGELSPLSGYLNAKLLWDPSYDEDRAINEFLDGVYGQAARPIRAYIDLIHDKVANENIHANIGVQARTAPYLTNTLLEKATALWDAAEKAVADAPDTLARVRIARLPVEYAILERQRGAGGTSQFIIDHEHFRARTRPGFSERATHFLEVAERAGVTQFSEGGITLDQFNKQLRGAMPEKDLTFTPLAPLRIDDATPGIEYACYEGTWDKLPDFDTLTPFKKGVAKTIGLDASPRSRYFALRFTGYLRVPRNGLYTFSISSNDGSRLYIGSKLVVDNDGLHGLKKIGGFIALRAGLHPIELRYFQEGGSAQLAIHYEGPEIKEGPLPASALFHRPGT